MTKACVIGAGFGGLALAIRLQSAGIATTLIEGRDKLGGRAYVWQREGYTFDAGPTVITDPDCLRELWGLSGQDIATDVDLIPVTPFYRLHWPDGSHFDYANDEAALRAEIARIAPGDEKGYDKFAQYSAKVHAEGYVKLGHVPFLNFASMIKAAPAMLTSQAWRSVYGKVSSMVRSEKLRQALSFHTLLVGGNPMSTSAIYALIHKLEKDGGVWWARGGTNRLVAGMAALFTRLGGTIRLGDPAVQVHLSGNRAKSVECASGWQADFDAVASNADLMHSYGGLLSQSSRGQNMQRKLAKKRWSPSLFVLHFAVDGTFPEIPHHMILFGPRYRELLDDIFSKGILPDDFSIYLHHPTVSDPSMAPAGKSTFYALVPVPHLGQLDVDWDVEGPKFAKRILAEVSRRLIPDLDDRLNFSFHYTPNQFATDQNAHLGSAFSLEPILTQSAYFRGHNRDDVIGNYYLTGAGTHPGAGIPGVVGSAKATAELMCADLGVKE